MRCLVGFLILLIGTLVTTGVSPGQWVHPNWSDSTVPITSLAVSGTTLLGTGFYGLFRSTDDGMTWTRISSGMPFGDISRLVTCGNTLYVGGNGLGVSTDNGDNWTAARDSGLTIYISALTARGDTIFAGTNFYGIFRSSNKGMSWSAIDSGLPLDLTLYPTVYALAVLGNRIFAGTDRGVFVSTNSGASWAASNSGLPSASAYNSYPPYVSALGVIGTILLASTNRGLYRSTDFGASWTATSLLREGSDVPSFAAIGTDFFAASEGGVFRSTDNGATWMPLSSGLTDDRVSGITANGTSLYAKTVGGGVFRSTDNGASWTSLNNTRANVSVQSLATIGSNLFEGTTAGVFLSTDCGASWSSLNFFNTSVHTLAVISTDLYAGIYFYDSYGGGILRSTNGGSSWTAVDGLSGYSFDHIVTSGVNIFTGGAGLYLSTDNGRSWSLFGFQDFSIFSIAINGSDLFVGSQYWSAPERLESAVYHASFNGTGWVLTGKTNFTSPCEALMIKGNNVLAGTGWNGILRSTDNGNSWIQENSGILAHHSVYCFVDSGMNVFAGSDTGVFLSSNNGNSWTAVNSGLTCQISALAICSGSLCAGTGGGVWVRPLSEMITSALQTPDHLLKTFDLQQNYPNPFNPSTTIRFEIPKRSRVQLTVYNVLGQQVAQLANEEMSAGNFERTWNANVASGLYFYRFEAVSISDPNRRFVDVKKMILLK
jgi:hypothetical protein